MALAVAVIAIVIISAFVAIEIYAPSTKMATKKPFYVGVTYCGENVTEADQLIDKVKDYTNMFVVQSGPLMSNLSDMVQICDYAVNSGLSIITYYSHNGDATNQCDPFLAMAQARWGSHFLGVYYDDEPGGKMLDGSVNFYSNGTGISISKGADGTISVTATTPALSSCFLSFHPSGEIEVSNYSSLSNENVNGVSNVTISTSKNINYYPNGTITSQLSIFSSYSNGTWVSLSQDPITYEPNGTVTSGNETIKTGPQFLLFPEPLGEEITPQTVNETTEPITDPGSISQFEPYQQLWDSRPLQTPAEVARAYVDGEKSILSTIGNESDVPLFTSDYALEWYDYQAGYNVVLGQLGWNQSVTQDIDMVRGAADMAGKNWGTIVTWASLEPPILMSGNQMYNALKQSYESGAQYVVVFNYQGDQPAQSGNSSVATGAASGLLQDPQFTAIQKFWTDVVMNPKETNNVKVQDALVLPANYGGAVRNPGDGTWGLWPSDNATTQVWNTVQSSVDKYGSKLDIIYDCSIYQPSTHYKHVVYWNETT